MAAVLLEHLADGALGQPVIRHDRPASLPVRVNQAGADSLRAARDDGYLLLRFGHGFLRSQVLMVAGSLGCGVSGVSSVAIHGSSGSAFTMASISAPSLARYKPRARP
jgi:hypothetical protein